MFVYKKVNLNYNQEMRSSLQNIYGIGWHKSIFISARLGFFYPFYMSNFNLYNWLLLMFALDHYTWLEVRIRRNIEQHIKNHFIINSYIGIRHKDRLPVRGQRTRTNARTKKRYKLITND